MVKQRSESLRFIKITEQIFKRKMNMIFDKFSAQTDSEEDTKNYVELISKLGASSIKDMGKIMGEQRNLIRIN